MKLFLFRFGNTPYFIVPENKNARYRFCAELLQSEEDIVLQNVCPTMPHGLWRTGAVRVRYPGDLRGLTVDGLGTWSSVGQNRLDAPISVRYFRNNTEKG